MLLLVPVFFAACGDPDINVAESSYEAKIVVEAYLYAGQTVQNIRIGRNYGIGQVINFADMALTPSANGVVASINGVPLVFDAVKKTYYNSSIRVEPGKTYSLSVEAVIDGKKLSTKSSTTVPQSGFSVLTPRNLGDIQFNNASVDIQYTPSVGASFYVFAFLADSASINSFIYDSPFIDKMDTADVAKNLNDYKVDYDCVIDIQNSGQQIFTYHMDFMRTRFYSPYRAIVYAGDVNFRNFLLSATNVEEMDGNYHEPKQVLEGDGIGVFASAIKDTVVFRIVK